MNFYLDSSISNGDTILTLTSTDGTNVSSTDIQAVMQSGSTLTNGDVVNLLANGNGITDDDTTTYQGTLTEGVSLSYPMTVKKANDGKRVILGIGDFVDDSDSGNGDDSGSGDDSSSGDDSGNDDTPTTPTPVDDSNNVVNVTSNSGTIYGGNTDSGNAQNNIVNLYGGTSLTNIYGGYAPSGSTSGNTLNVYNKNLTAQNVYNFDNLNFYIPNDAANGDTMLTLTDSAGTDISNKNIRAGVMAGNSNLAVGDTINLLTNSNGLTATGTNYGTLTEGVSLNYGLDVSRAGNSIVAKINSAPKLNSQTQSIPLSSGVSSIKTLDSVMDSNNIPAINSNFDFESDDEENDTAQGAVDVPIIEPKGWEIFASTGGGSLRTKAGDGSYVDLKTANFDVGFAHMLENGGAGKLAFAPIVDYSHGSYDSYLADGTHGTGTTKYIAGGLTLRNMWDNGFYVEGSARVGKVRNSFSSNDMDKVLGKTVSYNTSANTFTGHLKLGKNIRVNRNNILDVYATYYHAHQGGMNADLMPYGDKYKISSADSGRFRLGYRLTTRTSKISRIYTGLAYQYENASGITANYLTKNLSTKSAGDNGSSGMLEIGWIVKPLKNNPWAIDINATGWVGHQRGITAMAKVSKSF